MKTYEVVWEIFNLCPNNQMRDVFIKELQIEDTDEYVNKKFCDKEVKIEKSVIDIETTVYDIIATDTRERMSFQLV